MSDVAIGIEVWHRQRMVKTRHITESARSVRFQPRAHVPRLVDCLPLRGLFRRMPLAHWQRPEVLQFHLWIHVTAGTTAHLVDFETHRLQPGSVLLVRPGQVHRWDVRPGLDGHALLVDLHAQSWKRPQGSIAVRDRVMEDWPPALLIRGAARTRCRAWFDELVRSSMAADGDPETRSLLWHLAMVALLDARRSASDAPQHAAPAQALTVEQKRLGRFRALLERSYQDTRAASEYARVLRCSTRTLDRTTVSLEGRSAKELIDARVLLEAKRQLAHADATLEAIAHALGFSEATNFAKFFRRHEGTTPGAFRLRYRLTTATRRDGKVALATLPEKQSVAAR